MAVAIQRFKKLSIIVLSSLCLFLSVNIFANEDETNPTPMPVPENGGINSVLGDDEFIQPYRVFEMEVLNPYKNTYNGSGTGDSYSTSSGTVTFAVTDISIPGNSSIPIALSRWIPRGGCGVRSCFLPFCLELQGKT